MKNLLVLALFLTATTIKAQWTNSGNNYTSGQLAIGSSSTWAPITIHSVSGANGNVGVSLAFEGTNHPETGYRFKANGSNYYQVLYNGSSINWKHYEGGNYVSKLSLTNTGNLGIGTTGPSHDLEIAPSNHRPTIFLNARGTGNSANSDIFFGDNGNKRWSITHRPNDQNNDFVIWRNNSGWTKSISIDYSNGRVGIGTEAPTSELEVKSVSGNDADLHINAATDGDQSTIRFQDAGDNTWGFLSNYPQAGKFSLYNYQNTSNALILDSNGNLGIGTTSPSKLLDVNGDAKIGNLNSRQYLKISSLEWPEIRFQTPTSNEQIRLGTAHADNSNYGVEEGDLYVYTQTTGKMPFVVRRNGDLRFNLKGGNVGIGTNNTGTHKLSVNGSIRSKEVKVEANWSDFVFYDDYKLRTLEEVEQHINEKGHLPEIPSEVEVTENGINLGEMDAKLLQKIEELTLYLIEQNKRMNRLEAKNTELEKEISTLKNE